MICETELKIRGERNTKLLSLKPSQYSKTSQVVKSTVIGSEVVNYMCTNLLWVNVHKDDQVFCAQKLG